MPRPQIMEEFFQVAPAEAKFLYNKNPAFRKKSFFTAFAQLQSLDSRRGPGGDRKAPWSRPQVRNPLPVQVYNAQLEEMMKLYTLSAI